MKRFAAFLLLFPVPPSIFILALNLTRPLHPPLHKTMLPFAALMLMPAAIAYAVDRIVDRTLWTLFAGAVSIPATIFVAIYLEATLTLFLASYFSLSGAIAAYACRAVVKGIASYRVGQD